MAELTQITIDEIVTGILDGRRDFSNTILTGDNRDLSGHERYQEMQCYLQQESSYYDLQQNPVNINGSDWRNLIAQNIHLPFLKGEGADLSGADLSGAKLYRAVLNEAILKGAKMEYAVMQEAVLDKVVLRRADLKGAVLIGAFLYKADLGGAYLGDATLSGANLIGAKSLSDATYRNTIVSQEQYSYLKGLFERDGKRIRDTYFVVKSKS